MLMKRHPTLIPISREHHQVLLLAQLLKKDAPPYRDLPGDREGKIKYAEAQYHQLLHAHLQRDCNRIYPFLRQWPALHDTLDDLETRSTWLSLAFEKLDIATEEDVLDELGHALERYVRIKERQLFETAQQELEENDMQALKAYLQAH